MVTLQDQPRVSSEDINSSRVHNRISKPVPIQITLIRMAFHGMDSYFKPESRLPIWQPFDPHKQRKMATIEVSRPCSIFNMLLS